MVFHRLVEGGAVNFAVYGAAHVGHFFGALANQGDHYVDVGMVGAHAVRDVLEQGRLPRFGRRHYQPALPAPDWGEKVYQAGRKIARTRLQLKALYREYRRQPLELRAVAGRVRTDAVHFLHAHQAEVALAVFGGADLPQYLVARPQPETAYLRLRHVNVADRRVFRVLPQKAVAVVDDGEDAFRLDGAFALGDCPRHAGNEVVAASASVDACAHAVGELYQLVVGLGHYFCEIHLTLRFVCASGFSFA